MVTKEQMLSAIEWACTVARNGAGCGMLLIDGKACACRRFEEKTEVEQ